MNTEPANWTVVEKITKDCKVVAKLLCNGKTVHECDGPNARKALQEYAAKMNARGEPEPPAKVRIGADGYHFKQGAKRVNGPKTVMPSMQEWAKKHGLI